jgi:YesN/AraC family two-component response regulator
VRGKTLFLVEDDVSMMTFIRESFQEEYTILEARTYSAAIGQIREHMDLAIIDYVLPDGNGLSLVPTMLSRKPSLPVILMTAYSHEAVILKALRAGVRDYIRKPFAVADLRMRVSDILGENTLNEHNEQTEIRKVKSRREFIMDSMSHYIEEHYMKDLTLHSLASMAGMDKFSFSRAFKDRNGESFVACLNRVRIKRAAELMKNNDLNITDIALYVGYGSVEHFSRIFRATFGAGPREYRKSLIKKTPSE